MVLSVSLFYYNSAMLTSSSMKKRSKPKGIWKAQRVITPRLPARVPGPRHPPRSASDSDDSDRASSCSTASTASKKQTRYSPSENTNEDTYHLDYPSPYPDRVNSWVAHTKIMDTSTTAGRSLGPEQETFNYEDWEDLKELFAKAAEQYESALSRGSRSLISKMLEDDETSEALPLLRGVIHECHRFLLVYEDPSVIFMNRPIQSEPSSPPDHQSTRDYRGQRAGAGPSTSATALLQTPKERKW
jgi:hypothetical protein